jgi:hypothetical protein
VTPAQQALREFAHASGFRVRFMSDGQQVNVFAFDDTSRPAARCASIDEARAWLTCEKFGEP